MRKFLPLLLLLAACGPKFPDDYPKAEVTGRLYILWVGEGENNKPLTGSGDGRFVYLPDVDHRLKMKVTLRGRQHLFEPGLMYTDGGSIPRLFQVFKGLQPWGYGPAYVIHDWLFHAHRCLRDQPFNPDYQQVRGLSFEDTRTVMGSALRALMDTHLVSRNDIAASRVSWAVGGPIARGLWDAPGPCEVPDLKGDKGLAASVMRSLPPEAQPRMAREFSLFGKSAGAKPTVPVRLITTISF